MVDFEVAFFNADYYTWTYEHCNHISFKVVMKYNLNTITVLLWDRFNILFLSMQYL